MNKVSIGIDIAKLSYEAHIQCDGQSFSRSFKNSPENYPKLVAWIKERSEERIHVCMEASNRYWEKLAKFLHEKGILVSVVNPTCIHNYTKAN